MSVRRFHAAYSTKQKLGTNGKPACLECEQDITDPRRSTFCGEKCSGVFYVKTGRNVRFAVFARDNGMCARCGRDSFEGSRVARRARGSGHLWQADHIVPVVEGGGVCGIDNYRTLCTACHKAETAELARRRAAERAKLKGSS